VGSRLLLSSLQAALETLESLDLGRLGGGPGWTPAQVFNHCAASIECSMSGGYPQHRSGLFKATLGRLALGKFLRQGYLSHDRAAGIPGLPDPENGDAGAALRRLATAARAFQACGGELSPHFAYGPVNKADYDRVHAMHVADHLGALTAGGAPA
jgi:hypothetical protein